VAVPENGDFYGDDTHGGEDEDQQAQRNDEASAQTP
jgi:hypothetical protein